MEGMVRIRRALISVSDKEGVSRFASELEKMGVETFATGGTYRALKASGSACREVGELTRFPEMMDGRVKTLQPELFAAILARRDQPSHMEQLKGYGIQPIDMVVCNFYPFEEGVRAGLGMHDLIERVDIGGPSLVRASSKNYDGVTVVPSPRYYDLVLDEMSRMGGSTTLETRKTLAVAALGMVASYDVAIYNALHPILQPGTPFPERFFVAGRKFEDARYGENPEQRAAVYSLDGHHGMADWIQHFGERRSFNNHMDIGNALEILAGFDDSPAAATVKHGHVSGFAFAPTLAEAYKLAHSCDPEADFGGTAVFNRRVDAATAGLVGRNEGVNDGSVYTEIVIAPGYDRDAMEILKAKQKRKMRIIEYDRRSDYPHDVRILESAMLVQDPARYDRKLKAEQLKVVTGKAPDEQTVKKLLVSWELVRKVESNGIAVCQGDFDGGTLSRFWTLGVASFRKRSGAVKMALDNAGGRAKGAVAASDGFFPFRDNVDLLGRAGVTAVIQPGGSVQDDEVIRATNEYGMVMVFTGVRAFKH